MRVFAPVLVASFVCSLSAQAPAADSADVASVEAILAATYESISGPAGPRQWDRFRSLFSPNARLIQTGCNQGTGQCGAQVMSVDDFVNTVGASFNQNPFYEVEINHKAERYGLIAHVFSTYESRRDPAAEPFVRGINTFQVRYDGTRWWIQTIMWVDERSAGPIPQRYLPGGMAPAADPADVESLEAILAATYESISGPAGPRDWDRLRSLFAPEGRLIPTGCNPNTGACGATVLTVDEYISQAGVYFDANPFHEVEAHRVIERYGSIAHAFSTYESRNEPSEEPFVRGINSFQFRHDGNRWWVVSIMWVDENSAGPIPERYLP